MVAPSYRVTPVHATAATSSSSSSALVIDSTAVVGSDYLLLEATFTAGVSTAVPATHAATALTRAGWTLAGSQMQTNNDLMTTATFVKLCATGDPGATVNVASNVAARSASSLAIVKNASGYSAVSGGMQQGATTFGPPTYTAPANSFSVASGGLRWPSSTTPPVVPTLSGWTGDVDDTSTNANDDDHSGSDEDGAGSGSHHG